MKAKNEPKQDGLFCPMHGVRLQDESEPREISPSEWISTAICKHENTPHTVTITNSQMRDQEGMINIELS